MARPDWRFYYMPAFQTPRVDILPNFYLTRQDLLNREELKGGRVIGIWKVKAKTAKLQQELWKRSY